MGVFTKTLIVVAMVTLSESGAWYTPVLYYFSFFMGRFFDWQMAAQNPVGREEGLGHG